MQGCEGGTGVAPVVAVCTAARCACCHFRYGQWVDHSRPSQSHPSIVVRLRHYICGYEVHCHECGISPICQICQHLRQESTPRDYQAGRNILCCLCYRRRYPDMVGRTAADWHARSPDPSVTLAPDFPDPEQLAS